MANQQEEQILIKKTERTPNYDKVTHDVKKLLTATAATYIPELCEALRKDWFPRATDSTFARSENKPVRDEIREKVLDEWSKERNATGIYTDQTIETYFPQWLRTLSMVESAKKNRNLEKYREKVKENLLTFEKLQNNLPEVPKELTESPEEEEPVEYLSSELSVPKQKEKPTPEYLYGEVIDGVAKAWCALVDTERIPGINEDVIVDYLKPSDKHRLHMFKGLDYPRAAHCINVLTYLDMVIQRTLRMWQDIQKEPDNKKEIQR